ncbi:MAG: hypothetical protein WCQ89_16055 [Verrucomicrobiota bacterium]|jgi:hypothetical protein
MLPGLRLWLAFCLLWTCASGGDAVEPRFSQILGKADREAAGIVRLNSDEVAVIDALVRRDTVARLNANAASKLAEQFSQRLTPGERQTSGIGKLSPTELTQLDGLVDRHQNARLARTLLAPPAYLSRSGPVRTTETKREREIHGTFSLSYGIGSGGYSEKSGSTTLTLEDPAKGYSVTLGYSETHTKGGPVYRDPRYDYSRGMPLDLAATPRP